MALPKPIVVLLAVAAALPAADLPALRVEAVPAGSVLYVKNTAPQPLTAYLIELVDYPGSSFTLFDDDVANPVAPGAEKRIPITNMTVGAAPEYVKITAAAYADGATAGAPEKVALIVGRRKAVADTTRELIARLEKAKAAGTAKDALIADLKQWSDSLPMERPRRITVEGVSQATVRQTISNAVTRLQSRSIDDVLTQLRTVR